jgi:hypothetical protein
MGADRSDVDVHLKFFDVDVAATAPSVADRRLPPPPKGGGNTGGGFECGGVSLQKK